MSYKTIESVGLAFEAALKVSTPLDIGRTVKMATGEQLKYTPEALVTQQIERLSGIAGGIRYTVGQLDIFDEIRRDELQKRLDREFTPHVEHAMDLVVASAKLMGFSKVEAVIRTGVQGAGKQVNMDAIRGACVAVMDEITDDTPQEVASFIRMFGQEMGEVTTGDGGISIPRPPKDGEEPSDYWKLFGKAEFSQLANEGIFLPGSVMTTMALLRWSQQILRGRQVNEMNLFPRTDEQFAIFEKLMRKMNENGVDCKLDVVDLNLVSQNQMFLIQNFPKEFARQGGELGNFIKSFLPTIGRLEKKFTDQAMLKFINEILQIWYEKTDFGDNVADGFCALARIDEVNESLKRSIARGRPDDTPSKLLNRIRSSLSMAPVVPKFEQLGATVEHVATKEVPEAVVLSLICLKLGDYVKLPIVEKLIIAAQTIAAEEVDKGKKKTRP